MDLGWNLRKFDFADLRAILRRETRLQAQKHCHQIHATFAWISGSVIERLHRLDVDVERADDVGCRQRADRNQADDGYRSHDCVELAAAHDARNAVQASLVAHLEKPP